MNALLPSLDAVAEAYARLVLAVGIHDPHYVDAYYGPEEWKTTAEAERTPLALIRDRATRALESLQSLSTSGREELLRLRHAFLLTQLQALVARADMLAGTVFSFDEESRRLYDAVAPTHPDSHFKGILNDLDGLLPGPGTLQERHEAFRAGFTIPAARLDAVFSAAVEESRRRTRAWIPLPAAESFSIEYVQNQPWSGYNWYKGASYSLIQVNTDFPIAIDRALDLACHEGYPGHHVYNTLLEAHLVRERNWLEFSIYPLFSPQSLIAEGTANYGIDMAFPMADRIAFEQDTLFPMAGLDTAEVERYESVLAAMQRLSYAGNEAARRYLNGTITREEGARWLTEYTLVTPERAHQRMAFIEQNRSYVINYNLGQDLVKQHIEARSGPAADAARRWQVFRELLTTPQVPSGL